MVKRRYAIWDIDNCIADDSHRAKLVDNSKSGDAKYDAYNARMFHDPVVNKAVFDLFTTDLDYIPIFFTGRPQKYEAETKRWLQFNLLVEPGIAGTFYHDDPSIYMRPNGTKGLIPVDLKKQMLDTLLWHIPVAQIGAAFDDLPSVVFQYRAYGIPAKMLQIHDPAAMGTYLPNEL